MMNVGDWVSGIHSGEKFTGYILEINDPVESNHIHKQNCTCGAVKDLQIQVTIPKEFGIIRRNTYEVVPINDLFLGIDELNYLMEFANQIKDMDWIKEINKELSLWKGVNYLDEMGDNK